MDPRDLQCYYETLVWILAIPRGGSATQSYAVRRKATLRYAELCRVTLRYEVLCHAALRSRATLSDAVLC